MKKHLFIGIGILALIAIIAAVMQAGNTGNAVLEEKLLIGYCPSMEQEASEISRLNTHVEIMPSESTIDAIDRLKNNEVDVVLVGRKVKDSELQDSQERIIGSGYTLVSKNRNAILREELESLRVHTSLDKQTAESVLPRTAIVYHSSFEESIIEGFEEAVLISWDDYSDEMELVVVFDGELKAKEFRIPVLYSIDYDLEKINIKA